MAASTATPAAIEARDITRQFGDTLAVNRVSFSVRPGEIFGLLGPNASGKSTTIRLLSGIIRLTSGSVKLLGRDIADEIEHLKRCIGYVQQHFGLYPELTVRENLDFYQSIYRHSGCETMSTVDDTLERYGLERFVNVQTGHLSGGYKRRVSIACAVMHDPAIIFLDEPTAGIDPVSRKELWDVFFRLSGEGKTLFVTTHYMEEAERCDRLAFLNRGELSAMGTPTEILQAAGDLIVYACPLRFNPQLSQALETLPGVTLLNQFGNQLRIHTNRQLDEVRLFQILGQWQLTQDQVSIIPASIEDVFIELAERGAS